MLSRDRECLLAYIIWSIHSDLDTMFLSIYPPTLYQFYDERLLVFWEKQCI